MFRRTHFMALEIKSVLQRYYLSGPRRHGPNGQMSRFVTFSLTKYSPIKNFNIFFTIKLFLSCIINIQSYNLLSFLQVKNQRVLRTIEGIANERLCLYDF